MKRCLIINKLIRELSSKLKGETPLSTASLIALWQEDNNKDWESYPTAKELSKYMKELRKPEVKEAPQPEILNQLQSEREEDRVNTLSELEILKEISEFLAERIGSEVTFDDRLADVHDNSVVKGQTTGRLSYINLEKATLDTPMHEILAHPVIRDIKVNNPELYNNLLKELEDGYGREVLERVLETYSEKERKERISNLSEELELINNEISEIEDKYDLNNTGSLSKIPREDIRRYLILTRNKRGIQKAIDESNQSLEKYGIHEEALVQLLGEMASYRMSEKLKSRESKNLVSLLKRVLAQMGELFKSVFKSKVFDVSNISINTTLSEIADILGFTDSKIQLSGGKVEFFTPDGQSFNTWQEANDYMSSLEDNLELFSDELPNIFSLYEKLEDMDLDKELEKIAKKSIERKKKETEKYIKEDLAKADEAVSNMTSVIDEALSLVDSLEPIILHPNDDKIVVGYSLAQNENGDFYFKGLEDSNWYDVAITKEQSDYLKSLDFKEIFKRIINYEFNETSTKEIIISKFLRMSGQNHKYLDAIILNLLNNELQKFRKNNPKYHRFSMKYHKNSNMYESLIESLSTLRELYNRYENHYVIDENKERIKEWIRENEKYEKQKEKIYNWKADLGVRYNPEEAYSRGYGFYSVIGAYSTMSRTHLLQGLLQNIADNKVTGDEFTISATMDQPEGNVLGKNNENAIRIVIYPLSNDIKWAANRDVLSGSVGVTPSVFGFELREYSGTSYTKSPSSRYERNITSSISEALESYDYPELGISLNGNNFRLEYGKDAKPQEKAIVERINSILDQRYGKINRPEIKELKNPVEPQSVEKSFGEYSNEYSGLDDVWISDKTKQNILIAKLKDTGRKQPRGLITSKVYYPQGSLFGTTMFQKITPQQKATTPQSNITVKEGVSELFDSNPELANEVYEALGFTTIPEARKLIIDERVKKEISILNKLLALTKKGNFNEAFNKLFDLVLDAEKNKTNEEYVALIDFQKDVDKYFGYLINDINDKSAKDNAIVDVIKDTKEQAERDKLKKPKVKEQQKQQAQQLYSQYLDTIFPDSKVKDIVYHGTPKISKNNAYERLNLWEQYQDDLITEKEYDEKIKQFPENPIIEKFDKSKIGSQSNSGLKKGFYFSTNKKVALWNKSNNLYRVIVNTINPQIIEGNNEKINFTKLREVITKGDVIYKNTIDALENNQDLLGDTIVVQEPEQIHILGSQQDIEGFKRFVDGNQSDIQPSGTINVYWGQAESETSTKILSNLAPRKFTFEGREYGSVEHAYQSNKSGTFDEATYNAYNKIGGYGKKISGKGTVAEMRAANNLELMKSLVVESFKQNPNSEAAKKLMQYENFTHNTNTVIDKAFLEGLKLAQTELLQSNNVGEIVSETSLFGQESTSIQNYSYDVLGNKTQSNFSGVEGAGVKIVPNPNTHLTEQQRGEAVVAYRNSRNPIESFGNPFTDIVNRTTKENVDDFVNWILSENTDLNPEQHSWIRKQLQSGRFKGKPIYYGNTRATKENVPSHATALDYLINTYNWNTQITSRPSAKEEKKEAKPRTISKEELNLQKRNNNIDTDFDATTKRDRVNLMANLFDGMVNRLTQKMKRDLDIQSENATGLDKWRLKQQYQNLDYLSVLNLNTPMAVFELLKGMFQQYINLSMEQKIASEENFIRKNRGEINETQLRKEAERAAEHKTNEFLKIIKHFYELAEEASTIISRTNRIRMDITMFEAIPQEENPYNLNSLESSDETDESVFKEEESARDNWMIKVRNMPGYDTITKKVKKYIEKIPHVGSNRYDDLGNIRYINAELVYVSLQNALINMRNEGDMIKLLQKAQISQPWLSKVIDNLNENKELFTSFYTSFNREHNSYWLHNYRNGNLKAFNVNKVESVQSLLDGWRSTYEFGLLLDSKSIFETNGDTNIDNAAQGIKWLNTFREKFADLTLNEKKDLGKTESIQKTLGKLLNMIGVDMTIGEINEAAELFDNIEGASRHPFERIAEALNLIYRGVNNKSFTSFKKDGKKNDFINHFSGAFKTIAAEFQHTREPAFESTFRENNKNYASTTYPTFMGSILKGLKSENAKEFIEQVYKDFPQYFKGNEWLHGWLEELYENPLARKVFEHRVVLNMNKVEYAQWTPIQYNALLLNEFLKTGADQGLANYHIPIMSDKESAEFIRFYRYFTDEDSTFKEKIVDRLAKVVMYEYNRIMTVRLRDRFFRENNRNNERIDNYDIGASRKNPDGASVFRLLVRLNDYTVNGEKFIDALSKKIDGHELEQGIHKEVLEFIKEHLTNVMEEGFLDSLNSAINNGLFASSDNSQEYFGLKGQERIDASFIEALQEIIKDKHHPLGMEALILDIIDRVNNNKQISRNEALELISQLKPHIEALALNKDIDTNKKNYYDRELNYTNTARDLYENYYWNSVYATSQIIQMFGVDAAFSVNAEDFQKRNKQIASNVRRLNTEAVYKGQLIGKKTQRSIVINDSFIKSQVYNDVKELLLSAVKAKRISKRDMDFVLSNFGKVNITDGQSLRTLLSYRDVMIMSDGWSDQMEETYHRILNNKVSFEDINTIFQVLKPFAYTHKTSDSMVGHGKFKVSTQHKNSEAILFAAFTSLGETIKSDKLRALQDFMTDNDIDVVHTEGVVKQGLHGVINLEGLNTYEEIYKALSDATHLTDEEGNTFENENVIHQTDYADYGLQVENPEHLLDSERAIGTQYRKLIKSDLASDIEITIGDKKLDKQHIKRMYDRATVENIRRSFIELKERFGSNKSLSEFLKDQIKSSFSNDYELLKMVEVDENDEFVIPPHFPINSYRILSVLNSILKNNVIKQKTRGGINTLISNFGYTDELLIVFEGEGENKRVKHLEVYMPAYSRLFFEEFIDSKTKELDVNKLSPELREMIGYRVPTEHKYSILPLYIKGFLPQQYGSSMMLPAEVTTLTGGDFDIDKLYIILPEFQRKTELKNKKRAFDEFYRLNPHIVEQIEHSQRVNFERELNRILKENPDIDVQDLDLDALFEDFIEGHTKYSWIKNAIPEFQKWLKTEAGKEHVRVVFEKTKYEVPTTDNFDWMSELTTELRNNVLFDIGYKILTNEKMTDQVMGVGHFEELKRVSRIVRIAENFTVAELKEALGDNFALELLTLDFDRAQKILEPKEKGVDLLAPETQVRFHRQNTVGAKMISIYAVNNTAHALAQDTEMQLNPIKNPHSIDGYTYMSLSEIYNHAGEMIAKNTGQLLAASVDAVKENALDDLNQNPMTGGASAIMVRSGHSLLSVGLLMKQPILLEAMKLAVKNNTRVSSELEKLIKDYRERSFGVKPDTNVSPSKNMSSEELIMGIINGAELNRGPFIYNDISQVEYFELQARAGIVLKNYFEAGDELQNYEKNIRADSPSNAVGPRIADNIIKIDLVNEANHREAEVNPENKHIINTPFLHSGFMSSLDNSSIEYSHMLMNSSNPINNAFLLYGLHGTKELFEKIFPYYSPNYASVYKNLLDYIASKQMPSELLDNLFNTTTVFQLLDTLFFGEEKTVNENDEYESYTLEEKREYYLKEFPDEFRVIKTKNENLKENEFVRQLRVKKLGGKISYITLENAGSMTPAMRNRYTKDWESLLYSEDPALVNLALDLYRYSFFKDSLKFGPTSFIQLAPASLISSIPETINKIKETEINEMPSQYLDEITIQFIRHNLKNRFITKNMSLDEKAFVESAQNEGENISEIHLLPGGNGSSMDASIKMVKTTVIDGQAIKENIYHGVLGLTDKGGNVKYYLNLNPGVPSNNLFVEIKPLGISGMFNEYRLDGYMHESIFTAEEAVEGETGFEDSTPHQFDYNAHFEHISLFNESFDNETIDYASQFMEEQRLASMDLIGDVGQYDLSGITAEDIVNAKVVDTFDFKETESKKDFKDAELKPLCD